MLCTMYHVPRSAYYRRIKDPAYIAKNYLNRDLHADAPNQKWLTDVSEFKYYVGIEVWKVYLSAMLDLYDRRIISFVISDRNDNPLVMDTFDSAVAKEPDAHPLFHEREALVKAIENYIDYYNNERI